MKKYTAIISGGGQRGRVTYLSKYRANSSGNLGDLKLELRRRYGRKAESFKILEIGFPLDD